MTGDVDIVHRGVTPADSYRMHAQRVVAELMPADVPPADPMQNKLPTTAPSDEAKLKHVTADGGVTFNSSKLQFIGGSASIRSATTNPDCPRHRSAPATLLDEGGLTQGTFTQLEYNIATDRMGMVDFRAAIRRTGNSAVSGSNPDSEK